MEVLSTRGCVWLVGRAFAFELHKTDVTRVLRQSDKYKSKRLCSSSDYSTSVSTPFIMTSRHPNTSTKASPEEVQILIAEAGGKKGIQKAITEGELR